MPKLRRYPNYSITEDGIVHDDFGNYDVLIHEDKSGRKYCKLDGKIEKIDDLLGETFLDGFDRNSDILVYLDNDFTNCKLSNLICFSESLVEDAGGFILEEASNYFIMPSGSVYVRPRKQLTKQNRLVCFYPQRISYDSTPNFACVNLKLANKYHRYKVDDLMLKYFCKDASLDTVIHVDGDVHNCELSNLRFCNNEDYIRFISEDGEVWKSFPGTENTYLISNHGRVYRNTRTVLQGNKTNVIPGIIMSCNPADDGYVYYNFAIDKDIHQGSIHRAVAEAFLPNPDNLPEVNHKDGIKHNNYVDNLEWCTRVDNRRHAILAGLSSDNIRIKCVEDDLSFYSINEAAEYYGVDSTTIGRYVYDIAVPDDAQSGILNKHFIRIPKSDITVQSMSIQTDIKNSELYDTFNRSSKTKDVTSNVGNNIPILVYCVETNEEFESYSAAGRAFDCSASEIKKSVESGCTVHGHHFCKVGDKFEGSIESLPGEIWKPIPGFEDIAMISNRGRVKTIYRVVELSDGRTRGVPEKLRAIHENQVSLRVDGKTKYINVNRIVQSLFNV